MTSQGFVILNGNLTLKMEEGVANFADFLEFAAGPRPRPTKDGFKCRPCLAM